MFRRLMIVGALLCLLARPSAAATTPRDFGVLWLEPYASDLSVVYSRAIQYLVDQSYVITQQVYMGGGEYFQRVTVDQMKENLEEGYGIWLISTHGSRTGFAIQVYDIADVADRDADLSALISAYTGTNGFVAGDFYATSTNNGRFCAISISSRFIQAHFRTLGSLVINGSCEGHTWTSAWDMAQATLDYTPCALVTTSKADVETVLVRMDGLRGKNARTLQAALAGTSYEYNPRSNLNMVLSPSVTSCTLYPNSPVSRNMPVTITFDTEMDMSVPSWAVQGTGSLAVGRSRTWSGQNVLTFNIGPWIKGNGSLKLESFDVNRGIMDGFRGAFGQPLDGNGVGPNRDNFVVPVYVLVDNPAAVLSAFTAVRTTGVTEVRWSVESQWKTDRYRLYYGPTTVGPWQLVTTVQADSLRRQYVVVDPVRTEGVYELREIEVASETELVLAQAEVTEPFVIPIDQSPSSSTADSIRANLAQPWYPLYQPDATLPRYDLLYVIPSDVSGAWARAVSDLMADRSRKGFTSTAVTMDQVGNTREGLQAYIRYAFQHWGVWGVTLCGDAEDTDQMLKYRSKYINGWVYPDTVAWPSERQFNLIPTWDWPDPFGIQDQSASGFRPFGTSDWPYVDVDGDSLPDLALARLPVRTPAELTNGYAKVVYYEGDGGLYAPRKRWLFADQGRSYNGASGAWASALADSFASMLPAGIDTLRLRDTDAHPVTHSQALTWFQSDCAVYDIVGATFTGTVFNRNKMNWLDRTQGDTWSKLGVGEFQCAVVAPTCELAGFDRRVDPTYGRGLAEMSFASYRMTGPAWIWASNNASHQGPNQDLGMRFFFYAYRVGCRSAAEAVAAAVRDVGANWYEKYQALGTVVLGDAASPIWGQVIRPTAGVVSDARRGYQLVVPIQHRTGQVALRWRAPVGQSISIDAFDVLGRRVATSIRTQGTSQEQSLVLPLTSTNSGIVFIRLSGAGGVQLNTKCILLR